MKIKIINDKLFNKIKNILLKTKNYDDIKSILTGKEKKEEEIEKIIRISIVLLHDHHQKDPKKYNENKDKSYIEDDNEYHDIIINICNLLLLPGTSYKLIENINKFYEFTTGNVLRF